uniref:Uncharacterized protein n=1 Tax=Tanacetum cinerariifolium TaxID=118510 RepID=A0A699GP17_TANCI|nr:hypothetical protein [Tanacetum cinerariifolium]
MDACAALTRRVEHLEYDKVAQAIEITKLKKRVNKLEKRNKVRVLKLRRLQRVGTSQRIETSDDTMMDDESNQERMIAEIDQDDAVVLENDKDVADAVKDENETEPAEVQEVVDVVTTAKLITKVVIASSETVTAASAIIPTAETQILAATLTAALTAAPARVTATLSKRRKGVIIRDPEEESTTSTIIPAETKSKDKGKGILVDEPKPLKKKQQIEQDKQFARMLHAELNKDIDWDEAIDHNVAGFNLDYLKRMSYDDIRPIFEAKFNSNVDFLLKTKEQMEEEENRALQTINKTSAEKAAKRRKLNKEMEDLKRHHQIVPNEDDDVYTEATPLARKVPVVDYEIIKMNNKPYYKIIRADGTHQLCTCSNLKESKNCTWSSKGQELEATGIMWCAYHNLYNHTTDFVSEKEVPTLKIYSRSDVECYFAYTLSNSKFSLSGFGSYPRIICNIDKTPDLSQRSPQNCPKCGNPVDGHHCQECALLRKKFKEDLFTYCIENGILPDSSEPSNENTNVVNALQEPFVGNQDPGKNFSQSPPHINHHCCYECGDPLEDIFCHQCTCELCGRVTPSLSTKEPDNSQSMGDEHLDIVLTTESDEFIKSSVETLVPIPSESEGILDNMCNVPFHDNSPPLDVSKDQFEDFFDSNDESTSIDDDSFSIDNIEYVEASPPNSELVNLEVMQIVIPEETNTFDNSLPKLETFCFDLEEISSGSTTTRSDISLPEYEAFYDDHVKEISSGSTTTHFDCSLYDSFIFDLSINPFPPADRSDFYEFADELTHIISPPEYDYFCFKIEPNSGDFTIDVMKDTFPTREPRVHNALPTHPTFQLNLDFILSSESLFAYVVWIFLPFLSYSVAPQFLLSFRNEDTIFDPGICSYHISSFLPDVSNRSGTFIKFNILNESPMEISFSTCSPIDQ